MKLFVILSRVPFPLEKGDKLRAYHQLKELKKRHEITLICLNDSRLAPGARERLKDICNELHIFNLSKGWRIIQMALAFFGRQPFQVAYFYQPRIHNRIKKLIDREKPDRLFCQLVRTAEYVKLEHDYIKTIDYQDAFSKGMERRIENAPFYSRWLLRSEKRRLAEYENIVFEYFERKVIISEQDRDFILHNRRGKIEVVPNGVDTEFFTPQEKQTDHEVVFTGNMSYPPNVDSARILALEIMPWLWERNPEARLLIAGANPAPAVRSLEGDRITVTGWVDDIRDAYSRGAVFAAPMKLGSGLQNKLLEAMAMGLPCITTSLANNALGAQSGEQILIAEDAESFASSIARLLEDDNFCKSLAQEGRRFVKETYSWKSSTRKLENVLLCDSNAVD